MRGIALLGATGNVGGHYARLALDAGHLLFYGASEMKTPVHESEKD